MNTGLVIVFAFALISVSIGTPQFEIRDGNCTNLSEGEIVKAKHVYLYAIPFMTRKDSVRLTSNMFS